MVEIVEEEEREVKEIEEVKVRKREDRGLWKMEECGSD